MSDKAVTAQNQSIAGFGREDGHLVYLRYLHNSPLYVRGPATGRYYLFSGSQPILAVDARDKEGLLRTGGFRQVQDR